MSTMPPYTVTEWSDWFAVMHGKKVVSTFDFQEAAQSEATRLNLHQAAPALRDACEKALKLPYTSRLSEELEIYAELRAALNLARGKGGGVIW